MEHDYWRGPAADAAMQNEHGFVWRAMVDAVDVDLAGSRVLDVGCNQGGFLRLLADTCHIAEGLGYDPAAGAIEDARRLAGSRPLRFEVADTVPTMCSGIDVAFSHEVLYLLPDLTSHATAIFGALRPGGVYFAVMGVHSDSPMMVQWHAANRQTMRLPPLRDLDEVVALFSDAGFEASVGRLPVRFVPAGSHGHHPGRLGDWLSYYHNDKLLLRFSRPRR